MNKIQTYLFSQAILALPVLEKIKEDNVRAVQYSGKDENSKAYQKQAYALEIVIKFVQSFEEQEA